MPAIPRLVRSSRAMVGEGVSEGVLRAGLKPDLCSGLRRGATTQFAYQTRQLNSKARLAISRFTLDQKVEGSNPSSPATNCSGALCNRRPGDQVLLRAPLPLAPKAPKKGDPAPIKNPKSYQFPLLATL